jgi:hypothetical protein
VGQASHSRHYIAIRLQALTKLLQQGTSEFACLERPHFGSWISLQQPSGLPKSSSSSLYHNFGFERNPVYAICAFLFFERLSLLSNCCWQLAERHSHPGRERRIASRFPLPCIGIVTVVTVVFGYLQNRNCFVVSFFSPQEGACECPWSRHVTPYPRNNESTA